VRNQCPIKILDIGRRTLPYFHPTAFSPFVIIPSMSPPVFTALEALKKVSLTGKTDKALVDTVDSVTTDLKSLLLNVGHLLIYCPQFSKLPL
jgi:hypothetical protein